MQRRESGGQVESSTSAIESLSSSVVENRICAV